MWVDRELRRVGENAVQDFKRPGEKERLRVDGLLFGPYVRSALFL
jgi:hypothetical protein